MAPGLRLPVPQRLHPARPAHGDDRARQDHARERLPADRHRLAQARPYRPHATVADAERGRSQAHALHPEKCPIEYCELDAGDALIFHCNAIHRSDANRSPKRRWTLLTCYNRVDNDTIIKSDDRYFVPLDKVDDGAIRQAGLRFARGDNQEHFASRPYVPDLRKAS
jgi:hypothetical protein